MENLNNINDSGYINLLDKSIVRVLRRAWKVVLFSPQQLIFVLKTIIRQKQASRVRLRLEETGLHVPAFMILSITNKCNLKCKGCYAKVHSPQKENDVSAERQKNIFEEAKNLGISIILIAGGEPLTRRDIFNITKDYPEIIFPLFTNGMLINDYDIEKLKKQRHVIPVISIEGEEKETDNRRGNGVYQKLQSVFKSLKKSRIFYGVSITVTNSNYANITSERFIEHLLKQGCKLFIFVEYVPVEAGTENLELSKEQQTNLKKFANLMWERHNAIFIDFPGDEEQFGGCLAAGRGFFHINPQGDVEPCPFAPYSDCNLNNMSLRDALNSNLFAKIREAHNKLNESNSGCALWENRTWVSSLLKKGEK